MSELAHRGLQRACDISQKMVDAAASGNWQRVLELDPERQLWIRQPRPSDPRSREILSLLVEHNRMLMQRATTARDAVRQQLDQHTYNHRALKTYIASSG